MQFQPKPYYILDEDQFPLQIPKIEAELSLCANTGSFASFDGTRIAYQYFLCRSAKANIVVVHGFTEFYKKYYELAWYLLQEGYNVFLFDQRGHGLSQRLVSDPELVHIERFDDYAQDLKVFIDTIVNPTAPDLPLDIYAHSMGGTVSLFYLSMYSNTVGKAFLSAPMVTPYAGGIPRILIGVGAKRYLRKLGPTAHFPYSGRFDPHADFHQSSDSSFSRFSYYLNMRCENREYQTSGATNRWMEQVAGLQRRMLTKKFTSHIQTPICLISCEQDRVVRIPQQHKLAALLPNCQMVSVANAAHSLYTATGKMLTDFYACLFDFLR